MRILIRPNSYQESTDLGVSLLVTAPTNSLETSKVRLPKYAPLAFPLRAVNLPGSISSRGVKNMCQVLVLEVCRLNILRV